MAMKKLLGFLFGFATIVMVFGAVYIVALIYNTSRRFVVEPYFLRTGTQSTDSLGLPRSLDDVGKRKLRDWLIQKYVTEYFYIICNIIYNYFILLFINNFQIKNIIFPT